MMISITCPDCQSEGKISLLEADYEGPYRCWKCRALFTITLAGNELTSITPLTEEELARQQEMKRIQDQFKRD